MSDFNYWEECISEACDDAGLEATKEQIETLASWVEGAHDNYSMAHGYDVIGNPMENQLEEMRRKHVKELEDLERDYEKKINGWSEDYRQMRFNYQRRIEELEESCNAQG